MDERDGVEWPEQQFQHRQSSVKKNKSEIKQEKKMSKTESRFRSKLESLKKFQHSASTNSAVERARAFFRSLELKHLGSSSSNSDHSSSSSSRRRNTSTTTTTSHDVPLSPPCSKVLHPSSVSSSSSSSIIDDSHNTISTTTNDSLLYKKSVPSSNCIATARIIRVVNPNYSNSKDIIVHRVKNTEQDADHHHHFTSSYLNHHQQPQQNYHTSKQYYNNERSQSYSISFEKHRDIQTQYNSRPLSPASTINPNITYASHIYPKFSPSSSSSTHSNITNGNISDHRMSVSLYNYRPLVCRQMESSSLMSSSFHEQSDRLHDSIIRPLPTSASSSSMSTWTQSVRRLNSEYTSTINALQQAKDSLKQIYPPPPPLQPTDNISKYASFVAQGINNLSNNQTKKSLGVTFCLTTPISQNSSLSVSEIPKSPSTSVFSKPKLVRPLELDTFIPSIPPIPKLESIPIINEINDKGDSIANIIKKFNNLNHSSAASSTTNLKSSIIIDNDNNNDTLSSQNNQEKRDNVSKPIIYDSFQPKKDQTNIPSTLSDLHIHTSNSSPRVRFEPSVTTYELEEIPYESPPPPLSSSSSSSSSSLASEDSTSSTSSSSDDNQINGNHSFDHHHYNNNYNNNNYNQEETTYTVETFYKKKEDNKIHMPANHQQVVIIRENTTEEQFNLAQEKQQISSETNFQTNQTNISSLNPPLLTYLNLAVNQTTPTPPTLEKQEKIHDNYHSVEPSSHITNDLISDINHNEDDEIINDVVTINPYTDSPPSHRLNSSSSSSDTTSSASTVLLSSNTKSTRPVSSTVTQTPSSSSSSVSNTNGSLNKNNQKPNSQLPKRTTTTSSSTTVSNISRLKQPSKSVPSPSKLKPPSSTSSSNIIKPTKSMIVNSTSTSMRKPTGIMNQSTTMTNNSVNKTFQQESSSSSSILPSGKKQQLLNGTNMTESQTPTDSSSSMGKSRVRSMVNQFNAAVSSTSRPTIPTTVSAKRIPVTTTTSTINAGVSTVNNTRRPMSMEPTSTNKTTITSSSSNRPSLQRAMTISNQSPATSSPPSTPPSIHNNNNVPSSYKRRAPLIRSTSNVKEGLLRWCQVQVDGYPNVSVTNLSSSWSDGLAFCALTHHFFPDAFDFKSLSSTNRKENFELAFRVAEERAGVPQLLDVSDMLIMGNTPDYKCIFTYLNSFLAKVKDIHPTTNGIQNH